MYKKYLSGAQKRKRKSDILTKESRQRDSLHKFLKRTDGANVVVNCQCDIAEECSVKKITSTETVNVEVSSVLNKEEIVKSGTVELVSIPSVSVIVKKPGTGQPQQKEEDTGLQCVSDFTDTDPGTWPDVINNSFRIKAIQEGIAGISNTNFSFPVDKKTRRCFSIFHCFRRLPNDEKVKRTWLVYSQTKDAVYCFSCKLFNSSAGSLTGTGLRDWQGLSKALSIHELSRGHIIHMCKWKELLERVNNSKLMDQVTQDLIDKEEKIWRLVLVRLFSIICFLAERNLLLRGEEEMLGNPANGNFLGQVELMARFDPILSDHINRAAKPGRLVTYLSKDIQNEIISIISNEIVSIMTKDILKSKYYSIILDCTPDVSHKEQLSVILRAVNVFSKPVTVEEYCFGFFEVSDTTGKGLTESLLQILYNLGISLADCRGQSYDNASNMKGKNSGTQARIMKENPRARYIPCCAHSMNLVVSDAVKSSVTVLHFFGVVQRLFTLFSASVKRWEILKNYVNLTLKPLCDTRWEARIESVKVIRSELHHIKLALSELKETCKGDPMCFSEASSLLKEITKFKFLLCIVIWHSILSHINRVNKALQNEGMQLDTTIKLINATLSVIEEYRVDGFEKSKKEAEHLIASLGGVIQYTDSRSGTVKRQFSYESKDEPILGEENRLRINFFNVVVDMAVMSLKERFQQFNDCCDVFSVICDIKNLTLTLNKDYVNSRCKNLAEALKDPETKSGDINAQDLQSELEMLSPMLPQTADTCLAVLQHIFEKNLQDIFPNLTVALRVFLCMPVFVASAERSFSKLKHIKNYLTSSMSNERLKGLAIIAVEIQIARSLDMDKLVKLFAGKKARKVNI